MKTQLQTIKLRTKIHSEIRKNHLHQLFQCNRQLITAQIQKKDDQQFTDLYPTIHQSNFSSLLPQVKRWAWSEKFSNRTVLLVGYLYDYLLQHVDDNAMSILEALSSFQQIQIPQTKKLAIILISQLNIRTRTAMTIISNLLGNGRYSQYLRNYFLNLGLIQQCKRCLLNCCQMPIAVNQEQLNLLFVDICGSIITSPPLISIKLFDSLVADLSFHYQRNNEELVFWCINQISTNFQPNYAIAHSIDTHLGNLCLQKYFDYEVEIINYYHYCCSSQKSPNTAAIQLLIRSLDNCKQLTYAQVLLILTMTLKIQDGDKFQQIVAIMEQLDFMPKIMNKYEISGSQVKIKCLQILRLIIPAILTNMLNCQRQSQINESVMYFFQDFAYILADSIQLPQYSLQTQGLFLFLTVLKFIYDEEPSYAKCFKDQLQQQKVMYVVSTLPTRLNVERDNLISHIMMIYDSL